MKGYTGILAMVFLIAILITAGYSYGVVIGVNEGSVKKILIERDIYVLGNALDYSKLFLDTSIKYSTYQAVFDYGLSGEWSPEDNIEEKISAKIQENLNKYTKNSIKFFSEKYKIDLPQYRNVNLLIEGNKTIAAAEGDKVKIVQKSPTEAIELKKNSSLHFNFEYNLFGLAERFLSNSVLENRLSTKIKQLPKSGKSSLIGCENKGKKMEGLDVFNKASDTSFTSENDAQNSILLKLLDEVNNTLSEEATSNTSWSFSVISNSSQILLSCEEEIQDKCEDSYSYIKTCAFDYNYSINFSISLTDLQKKYPVESGLLLDKKTSLENMKLTFKKAFNAMK